MTYCGRLWQPGDDLTAAQPRKLDYLADQAKARVSDRVPDVGRCWGSFVNRLVKARDVTHAVGLTLSVAQQRWATEAVVSISFDRSRPADIEAARACDEALHDAFAAGGYGPYRLGVQHQGRARTAGEEWGTIEAIEQALDPAAIIAPGKYGP